MTWGCRNMFWKLKMSFFYQELSSLCCLYDRLEIAWAVRTDDNIFLTDGYLNLFERTMNRFWTAIRLKTIRNAFAREVTYFTLSFNSLCYLHVLLQLIHWNQTFAEDSKWRLYNNISFHYVNQQITCKMLVKSENSEMFLRSSDVEGSLLSNAIRGGKRTWMKNDKS